MHSKDQASFSQVVERIAPGGRLLRAWDLEGGVSARTVAIEFEKPCGVRNRAVIRLHGEVDRADNPNIAADEFRLLQIVHAAGIAVPEPLHLDRSCELFEIPYLAVSFVDGSPVFVQGDATAALKAIAGQLAEIHRVEGVEANLRFLPRREERVARRLRNRPAELDDPLSESRIREVLEPAWPPAHPNQSGLLHGDYWQGNLLWKDGEIAAVIDWEDAAIGDPLADVGNCRLDLFWSAGREAMDAFTEYYRALMPSLDYRSLPLWDLAAALHPAGKLAGWGLDAETEAKMVAAHRQFVDLALEELGV